MKKSIKKNYIYNVLYQLLLLITPLITAPYLARVLGADGVGTASYVESIVSYFTLFATMGMTTFGQREISYVQDDKEKRTQIFWETNILELMTASIAIVVYFIFAIYQDNRNLYLVLIFNIFSVVVNITWFFQGMEEFGRIVLRNTIFKLINIVFVFLFIKEKEDLVWYLFGISFFSFLSNISLWFFLPKYIGKPEWKKLKPFRHIRVIISLFVPTIAIQIYTVLDKTMIGLITRDAYENGYYEQAIKISKVVMTVVTSLGTVMIPRIGYYFSKKEGDEVKRLMYRGYHFVWFLGVPLCFGLMAVAGNFVPWFFGEGYEQTIPLLMVLALLVLIIGISNVTGMQYLIPTQRENLFTLTVIFGAVVNFMMNAVLIKPFQAMGAAIASIMAEVTVTVVQLLIVRKELSLWQILKEGRNYYIAGIVMFGCLMFIGEKLLPSIVHTALLVIFGSVIYFGILLLIKDEFMLSNLKHILKK